MAATKRTVNGLDVSEVMAKLAEPFPEEQEVCREIDGKDFWYIKVPVIMDRLDKVLGLNWTSKVTEIIRTSGISYEVFSTYERKRVPREGSEYIVTVEIMIYDDEGKLVSTRTGIGAKLGEPNMKTTPDGLIKAAKSQALKNAAESFGVGLYLKLEDDEIEDDLVDNHIEEKIEPATKKIKAKKDFE